MYFGKISKDEPKAKADTELVKYDLFSAWELCGYVAGAVQQAFSLGSLMVPKSGHRDLLLV